jgi:hypothetical protein
MGAQGNSIIIDRFAIEKEISGGGDFFYDLDMERYNLNGFASIQVEIVGGGKLTMNVKLSNNGVDYVVQNGASPVFEDLGSGVAFYGFSFALSRYLRLYFLETAGIQVTLSAWLAIQ